MARQGRKRWSRHLEQRMWRIWAYKTWRLLSVGVEAVRLEDNRGICEEGRGLKWFEAGMGIEEV